MHEAIFVQKAEYDRPSPLYALSGGSIKISFVCSAHWNACDCVLAMGTQATGRQKQCRTVASIAGNFGNYGQ